ncbi:MAG TPA: hypothetical protein VF338_07505, partial [Leptolinea sp.]
MSNAALAPCLVASRNARWMEILPILLVNGTTTLGKSKVDIVAPLPSSMVGGEMVDWKPLLDSFTLARPV